jgi:dimethylglycine dehydrogenase
MTDDIAARVVVIGGGIVGCSILYHLTRCGWNDVALVERAELTAGSTWHAAANTHTLNGNAMMARLQHETLKLYETLEADTGSPIGLHRVGGVFLASTRDRLHEFQGYCDRAKVIGFDLRMVTVEEIKAFNPLLDTTGLIGGMYDPLDGHVDPNGVTHAFANGARQRGARVFRHSPVVELCPVKGGGWRVITPERTIRCDYVVNAAGFHANEIAAMTGHRLPIVAMEHQYLVTETMPALAALNRELPLTREPDASYYLRQEGQGLLIGVYEKDARPWAVDGVPPGFGQELLPADLDRLEENLAHLMRRVPAFAEAGIKRVVNGPFTFTPDARPLVGPLPGHPTLFVAAGFLAGFSMAGGFGRVIAEWIVEGEPPLDLFDADVTRFGDFATRDYCIAKIKETYTKRYAIAYPLEERPAGRPLRVAPLHSRHKENGAAFGFAYGWERPLWYAGKGRAAETSHTFTRPPWFEAVGRECRALREGVGLLDMSVFAKYEVEGADAVPWLDRMLANRLPEREGAIRIAQALDSRGRIVGDFTVTRVGPDRFYLIGPSAAEAYHLRWFENHHDGYVVSVRAVSGRYGIFGIAGPKARTLLSRLARGDVSSQALPFLRAVSMDVGPAPARVMRLSFTGDLGYEIHFPIEYQVALYDALKSAGGDLGLVDVGAYALDSLRLEKGYGRWGLEYTRNRTPFEAGLGRFVDLDKGEFIGRAALLARKTAPARRKLVVLSVEAGHADSRGDEPVYADGALVGATTSGGFGHAVGKSIALAYVPPEYAVEGGELAVQILGERRPAQVSLRPLFDPEGARLRG